MDTFRREGGAVCLALGDVHIESLARARIVHDLMPNVDVDYAGRMTQVEKRATGWPPLHSHELPFDVA